MVLIRRFPTAPRPQRGERQRYGRKAFFNTSLCNIGIVACPRFREPPKFRERQGRSHFLENPALLSAASSKISARRAQPRLRSHAIAKALKEAQRLIAHETELLSSATRG
jgi:hypothetical protein